MTLSRRTFIRASALLAGLTTVDSASAANGQIPSQRSLAASEPVPNGSTRVPVDDPYITVGQGLSYMYGNDLGIPDLTRAEFAREVLKLHPDFWNQRYITGMNGSVFYRNVPEQTRDGMDLSASLELSASLGFSWMPRDVPLDRRPAKREMSGYLYGLSDDEQWPAPDGSPAAHPLHASNSRDLDGTIRQYFKSGDGTAGYSVSMYAPGPTEYHATNNAQAAYYGANATEMDSALGPSNIQTGDFSVWAKRAFRNYLRSLPADRFDRLGIESADGFDVQQYVQRLREDINRGSKDPSAAVTDPIVFEYYLMEQSRLVEFYEEYASRGKDAADSVNAPLTVLGNQGSNIASERSNGSIVLSQVFDVIEMEGPITLPGASTPQNGYHPSIRTTPHKRAAALRRALDKPVVEMGFYGTANWSELDPTRRYPTLETINCAEVFANGSTRQMDFDGWNNLDPDTVALTWLDPEDGTVPDELRSLADFIWTYRDDIHGTPRSDVAVVYSIPTMLAKPRPFVDRRATRQKKMIDGMVRAARERQIPTDLLVFGHPDLWDDAETLDRLSDYSTIVFPSVTALTDAQNAAVSSFLDGGGTVLYEGEFGTRDAYYRSRTPELQSHSGAQDVGNAGVRAAEGDVDAAGTALEDSLSKPLVRVSGPATLSCEVVDAEDGWSTVHIVNYDYDAETDSVTPVTNVDVSLYDPSRAVSAVDVVRPGATPKSLAVAREGDYAAVTLDETGAWSVVRFKTAPRTSDHSQADANTTISSAAKDVQALGDGDRQVPRARADAALYEARLLADAGQYDRAVEHAERASTQASAATDHLRVGIDSGHGQASSRTLGGLKAFREKYGSKYDVSFSEVTELTPETLNDLDGLLVGSALSFKGQSYTYTTAELDAVERFVANGGRVAIVVRPGVDGSVNDLTERFGVTVDPHELDTPNVGDRTVVSAAPATYRTPITYQLVPWWVRGTCSLTELGDEVTVQIRTDASTVRRSDGETGSFPVSAVAEHGNGAVVVHCSDTLFEELRHSAETQARNILRFLGTASPRTITENTATTTKSGTTSPQNGTTTTAETTQEATSSTTETSAGGTPGFTLLEGGVSTALAYLFREVRRSDDSDE